MMKTKRHYNLIVAFTSTYLKDPEKDYLIEELKLLAVVRGQGNFCLHLYDKIEHFFTEHQALEPIIKQN